MSSKLKVIKPLVIGLGVAGKRHLKAQLQLGIQTGVYSLNIKKIDPLRKQRNVLVFDSLEEAIDWSNLVHICTPDDKHTEYVAEAVKKRKAVLCEKSFTTSLKDALYLQKLVHENNSILVVGQNYRLTPTFSEIKKRVANGELGAITRIETTYLHNAQEYQQRTALRKNEDFLYIGGSHAIDLACWIIGEQVLRVKASSFKPEPQSKQNVPANYNIVLKFASGLLGYIQLDASLPQPRNGTDLIVEGEKGRFTGHNKSDDLLFYEKNNKTPKFLKFPNNITLTTALEVKIIDNYLLGKLKSFYPLPDIDDAVNIIRILDTIQKAVLSGKNERVS